MEKLQLSNLLKNYASNTITDQDRAILFEYFRDKFDMKDVEPIIGKEWDELNIEKELDEDTSERIFNQIIGSSEKIRPAKRPNWMGWAAVLLLVGFGAFYFWRTNHTSSTATPSILNTTVKEDHEKIILPDGSSVVLNSNSKLVYPARFSRGIRAVTLSGEGYFEIKHDASKPFIVRTGKLTTTVLGTAFNIRTSDNEQTIVVTVTRGKVSVSQNKKVIGILKPNQQIAYNSKLASSIIKTVTANQVVKWQANDIFFKDVTLQEAMEVLSARFNKKISFTSDTGKDCRFTATFLNGESLEEILMAISAFNGSSYKIMPGEITISGKACNNL